jgi:hypothetical protein
MRLIGVVVFKTRPEIIAKVYRVSKAKGPAYLNTLLFCILGFPPRDRIGYRNCAYGAAYIVTRLSACGRVVTPHETVRLLAVKLLRLNVWSYKK